MTGIRPFVILAGVLAVQSALAQLVWPSDPNDRRSDGVRARYIAEMIAERVNPLLVGGTSANGTVFSGVLDSNGIARVSDAFNVPTIAIEQATGARIFDWVAARYRPSQYLLGLENLLFEPEIDPTDSESVQVKLWCDLLMSGAYCTPESVGLTATSSVAESYAALAEIDPGRDGWMQHQPEGDNDPAYYNSVFDRSVGWQPMRAWQGGTGVDNYTAPPNYYMRFTNGQPRAFASVNYPHEDAIASFSSPLSYGYAMEQAAAVYLGNPTIRSLVPAHLDASSTNVATLFDTMPSALRNLPYWDYALRMMRGMGSTFDWQYTAKHRFASNRIARTGLRYSEAGERHVAWARRSGADWQHLHDWLAAMRFIPLDYSFWLESNDYWPPSGETDDAYFDCDVFLVYVRDYDGGDEAVLNDAYENDVDRNMRRVLLNRRRQYYGEWCGGLQDHRDVRPGPVARSCYTPFAYNDNRAALVSAGLDIGVLTNLHPIASLTGLRYPVTASNLYPRSVAVLAHNGYMATNRVVPFRTIFSADIHSTLTITGVSSRIVGAWKEANSQYAGLRTNALAVALASNVVSVESRQTAGRWTSDDMCTMSPWAWENFPESLVFVQANFTNAWAVMEWAYK